MKGAAPRVRSQQTHPSGAVPASPLVLSLFPGIGMLDHAFEAEGFTTVRGPDPLWGGDVRRFHPPAGVFAGVIGGDPCQSHSSLANLVRAKGLTPRFPDLTAEYQRCVEEAGPDWFLRENTPQAPDIAPEGYCVTTFVLDNAELGERQRRQRRFWFGWRAEWGAPMSLLWWLPRGEIGAEVEPAVSSSARAVPVALGGSGKPKASRTGDQSTVCAGSGGDDPSNPAYRGIPNRSLAEMLELQGLPGDWLDHQPWTMTAKRRMVGNGVPIPMGRALAQAIRKALDSRC